MQAHEHDYHPERSEGPRSSKHDEFLDHERLTRDRFRCPECGRPLELVELRQPPEMRKRDPDAIEWIACCRRCEIALSREDWARRKLEKRT